MSGTDILLAFNVVIYDLEEKTALFSNHRHDILEHCLIEIYFQLYQQCH